MIKNKRNYRCLMIRTKDHRMFFTPEKNYPQLIEFSKVFNAEISIVKVKNAEVLDLHELAPAICDSNYKRTKQEYEIIEKKCLKNRRRKTILESATKIRNYIQKQFLKGKIVSLHDIAIKFKKENLTTACLCNHLTSVRTLLEKQGYTISKIGGGKYKIPAN